MKKHTLLAAVLGSALLISGCANSGGSSNGLTGANFQNAAPGTVTIFRQDPSTGITPPANFKPLTFTGIAVNGQITFGPVQRPAEAITTLTDVPVGTHHILVEDPSNPSVAGEVPVQVFSGRTTHASDLVMQPSGPDRRNGILAKDNTAPVAVGDGFIQTERSTVGAPGANSVMAGYAGYAVTPELAHPYRTNSWLTPLMAADNHHKIYLGSLPNPPAVDPNGDKALGAPAPNYLLNTQWQLPVYPHPWAIHYNQRQIESGPSAGQPNGRQGLLLDLETVRVTDGAQVPAPQGGDAYTGSKMAELNATLDNLLCKS